ncbi:hypothetical protein ACU686_36655 [Yinghuangia aomiensis]
MNEIHVWPVANPGYADWQLAKAFVTAASHEDAATRRRADERVRQWTQVGRGMADGSLSVGSRTPVRGLPAWGRPGGRARRIRDGRRCRRRPAHRARNRGSRTAPGCVPPTGARCSATS